MKVLLIGDYPPPYGGIAVHVQHLARALPGHGVACRVLNIGRSRRVASPHYESVAGAASFLRALVGYGRAGYLLHVFTNGENWKSWAIALTVGLVARLTRAPSMVTITSGGAPAYLAHARPWVRGLVRTSVVLPDALVCRTAAIAAAIQPWRRQEIAVIPAFSAARLRPAAKPSASVAAFADVHRPLVVSVAILRWEYDLPTLLQAFRDLRKVYPRAGLVIVGDGEDRASVRELVDLWQLADSVLLAGWVGHDECLAIMREADLFVRTTLYDGDASSVREALALGVPVVASRTDFRPSGLTLFPPGDPDALQTALVETLAREVRASAGAAAAGPLGDEALITLYRRLGAAVPEAR
jgi:glycosyltransferase involved in cell wall biosynthesis